MQVKWACVCAYIYIYNSNLTYLGTWWGYFATQDDNPCFRNAACFSNISEQEQDALIERMRKEREQRKKKEEEEALTLEQTKEQVIMFLLYFL